MYSPRYIVGILAASITINAFIIIKNAAVNILVHETISGFRIWFPETHSQKWNE